MEDALASYRKALALRPDHAKARQNLGSTLTEMRRFPEAIECYEGLLAADASNVAALGPLAFCCAALCDFARLQTVTGRIAGHLAKGKGSIEPFVALALSLPPALRSQNARRHAAQFAQNPLPAAQPAPADKIRIAYLSPDFRDHPVASAIAELIERHDRTRFEIFGIALHRDDDSEMRARLVRSFDHFHDVTREDDRAVVARLREFGIHIAVDLAGHTRNSRPGIFARKS